MTFTKSNGVIRQSSIDTDLSGLVNVGATITGESIKVYDIGTDRLLIYGDLTIDPEVELLFQRDAQNPGIKLKRLARLQVGKSFDLNGVTRYSEGTAIHCDAGGSSYQGDLGSIAINGTLDWYGGVILFRSAFGWLSNSIVNVYSQSAVATAFAIAENNQTPQIRQRTNQLTVNGITLDRTTMTMIANPAKLQGVRALHCSPSSFQASSSTSVGVFITVRDYDVSGGAVLDFAVKNGSWFRAINSIQGSEVTFGEQGSAPYVGLLENRTEVAATASDISGQSVSGWGLYIRDRDSGKRLASDQLNGNPDYQGDRSYTAVETSGFAVVDADGGVLISVKYDNDYSSGTTPTNDYRGGNLSSDDVFSIRVRRYGYLFQSPSVALKGRAEPAFTLIENPAVNQTETEAQGHSGITVTDHGSTPVSWNGYNWSITVTGDKSVNGALTATDIYHALQWHLSQVDQTYQGKVAGEWHELVVPGFETQRGEYGGNRIAKGVRVVDESDNPFPGFIAMVADDGSQYIPPVTYSLTFSGIVPGSEVRVYEAGTQTERAGTESSGNSFTFSYQYAAGEAVDYVIYALGYQPIRVTGLDLSQSDTTIAVQQTIDRVYGD